ncbi:MAG: hypothetical protein AAGG68_26330 [Bacteroidota bacterium]
MLDSFYAPEVSKVSIDTLQPQTFDAEKPSVHISKLAKENLKLNSISGLNEKAKFDVSVDNGEITFELNGLDSISCNLSFSGARLKIADSYDTLLISPRNQVFQTELLLKKLYFDFRESSNSDFFLRNTSVDYITFTEVFGTSNRLKSKIVSGDIKITSKTDTLKAYTLRQESFISIDEPVSLVITELYRKGDYLKIELIGKAKDVRVGIEYDEMQSLKPTLIGLFSENESFNLFWKVIMGVLGLISALLSILPKLKNFS